MKNFTIIRWIIPFIVWIFISNLNADEVRWLRVGMLQNWFSSGGCEIEVGRRNLIEDQQDGFRYPALYPYQDMQVAKALWLGATDYADPLLADSTFEYKVVHIGPRVFDETLEFMPRELKLIGRCTPPEVLVNELPASALQSSEQLDEIDEQLPADRMISNIVNTSLGVTITRKIYAYAQPYHDNYFIYDYTFTNTGVYDRDGSRHTQTLQNLIVFFQYRWAISRMPCHYGYYWAPGSATWGHNTVNEILHPEYGDDYRAVYAWHGQHSEYSGNNIGAPNIGTGRLDGDGFLGAAQFPGVVTLHADRSAADESDDPTQFAGAPHFLSDHQINWPNDQFDAARMSREYEYMSRGIPTNTHASLLRFPHNPGWQDAPFTDTRDADDYAISAMGGKTQSIAYGPYTLPPDKDIHIVIAECVGSLDWQKRYAIGNRWYHETMPYLLPDGSQTEDRDAYKDAWVFTGRDSLLATFDRAISTWDNDLAIDPAPPPPDQFTVIPGGDRMRLVWSANPESYAHFGGYRLFRQIANPDTSFELIYECGQGTGNPVGNEYIDWDVQRGTGYFYYIISFDDGTVNTLDPGKSIYSSLFWTRTIQPAYLLRRPGHVLEAIRIVPNPFHFSASEGESNGQNQPQLMFYNLPPQCLIKILTERGDLIHTIHHDDNSGEDAWNLLPRHGNAVVSGLYIAYFQITADTYQSGELRLSKGSHITKKFLIIR